MAITKRRGAPTWELEEDKQIGLARSVANNQPQLALMYAEVLIRQQQTDIDQLKAELADLKSMVRDIARTSSEEPAKRRGRPPAEEAIGAPANTSM